MPNKMATMQGCCCDVIEDPCDLVGDPPDAMQVTTACGGTAPWSGTTLLPNQGTLDEMKAGVGTGGRDLGNGCYYYWSDDLGSGKYFVLGVNNGPPSQTVWAVDTTVPGNPAWLRGLWSTAFQVFDWDEFDAGITMANVTAFAPCNVGNLTAQTAP